MGTHRQGPRRSGRVHGLLVVNAALLALLGVVTFSPAADAQARSRGNYVMVAGGVAGSASGAVYIVDTVNEELIALTWEPNDRELLGVGYRNLSVDATTLAQPGRGR